MAGTAILVSDVLEGHRLTVPEATLSSGRKGVTPSPSLPPPMRCGRRRVGDVVTYVRNQNPTSPTSAKNLCGFCGFGRKATDEGA